MHRLPRNRVILALAGGLILLPLLPPQALAQPPGWECQRRNGAGECLGQATRTYDNGTRLSGLRREQDGRIVWSGAVVRYYRNGDQLLCEASPEGLCAGRTVYYRANGNRETGTMQVVDGHSAWTGWQTTRLANGNHLECEVAASGLCEGEARFSWPNGDRMDGRQTVRGGRNVWSGPVTTVFANGDRKECEADAAGSCVGATRYTYADGTRLQGRKTVIDGRETWTGRVIQTFPSGRRMECLAPAENLCSEETQMPTDREGRPLRR
jgi:hypothetical protein